MARRISASTTLLPTVFADTTAMTNALYPFDFLGSTATQLTKFWEISISGQAPSSSSPTFMLFSRDSTIGVGAQSQGTGGTDSFIDPATAALASAVGVGNTFATSGPQRDTARHLVNASLNAFGGVYFWRANRFEECMSMLGNTAALFGSCSLSAFTGGTPGLIGSHMIYETL
jgi:hypothetical protein